MADGCTRVSGGAARINPERPLSPHGRDFLEAGFQQDLGGIRIHAGPLAGRIARLAGARAFAIGPHIVLDREACECEPDGGHQVLAHEIAHSVQQSLAPPGLAAITGFGGDDDFHEREAWDAARHVVHGGAGCRLTPDGSGLWRRAVSVLPGSAKLLVTARPKVQAPTVSGANATFQCTAITAAGEVTLRGAAGDSARGWQLGFVQAQWIETNWGDYRGQHDSDGSLFLQRARPPARPSQACRDTVGVGTVSNIWYNTGVVGSAPGTGALPAKLTSSHYDKPGDTFPLVVNNSLTGKPNFLHEVQLEFHFCFVLSLRDPSLRFHHLKALYWNTRWQARFHPASFAAPSGGGWSVTPVTGANAASVGHVIDGAPTDHRFTGVLTSAQTANCNAFASGSATTPNKREARTWQNFSLT